MKRRLKFQPGDIVRVKPKSGYRLVLNGEDGEIRRHDGFGYYIVKSLNHTRCIPAISLEHSVLLTDEEIWE